MCQLYNYILMHAIMHVIGIFLSFNMYHIKITKLLYFLIHTIIRTRWIITYLRHK